MLESGADEVMLVQGRNGVFEIICDDRLVYSKKATGRFPTDAELNGIISN